MGRAPPERRELRALRVAAVRAELRARPAVQQARWDPAWAVAVLAAP